MLAGSSRGWRGPRFEITIISNACILEQSEVVATEFRQPIQVQSHLEMPGILVQLGCIQHT